MIPLAAFAVAACLPVDAARDRITAADLARALPEWSQAAPDTEIGYAPAPGVVRVLSAPELRRLGARFGVTSEAPREVCFERPSAPVTAERMLAAMRERMPEAHIRILETSRAAAPGGELDFPLSGLRGGYWFGRVTYGSGHRFVVWARVTVTRTVKRVVASADLSPGRPIDAAQLKLETREESPVPGPAAFAASAEELAGWIPRRRIPAGAVVQKQWLDPPQLVQRGQLVKVEVVVGGARLEAEGVAEASGALGQVIPVQNPDSKRHFRARVEAAGRVSVKGTL
jgi:flagella basal body P-ring formation protein FlgA